MTWGWILLGSGTVVALILALTTCSHSPTDKGDEANEVESVFEANYLETFVEVRDCRFSSSHPGMIRILVNEVGAEAYLNDQNPLPHGTIVVKEVFDGTTCSDYSELGMWSAMRKEAAGFDPDDGDWHWQDVLPDQSVLNDTKMRCIGCHRRDDCVSRDYMCTTNQ